MQAKLEVLATNAFGAVLKPVFTWANMDKYAVA